MIRHIGIVACSAEGAALCYRTICAEAEPYMGAHNHPELSMHTHALAEYVPPIESGDWAAVADLMLSSADKLARIGAEVLICPDNTIHQAMDHVLPRSPLPWIHIAEAVADEAVARGYRRIGITGTRWLTESAVYPDKLESRGLSWMRPSLGDREAIGRIIMDELVRGIFTDDAVTRFEQVIADLKSSGCDAVVLGCTEIPLIIDDANSPLPTLDSTRLLARAVLRYAVG